MLSQKVSSEIESLVPWALMSIYQFSFYGCVIPVSFDVLPGIPSQIDSLKDLKEAKYCLHQIPI